MKQRILVLLATLVLAVPAAAGPWSPAMLRHPMVDLEGRTARLDDVRGEVTVVNFWASWCPPCREELPALEDWHAAWTGTGVRVVAVSIDRRARNVARFVADAGLTLPVLVDGPEGLAAQLDLRAVPTTYLLDRDGDAVMVVEGSDPADLARLRRAAEDLRAPVVGRSTP